MVISLLSAILLIPPSTPLYQRADAPVEARVSDLLRRMTVQEKIAQLRADGDPNVYEKQLQTTGFGFLTMYPLRPLSPRALAEKLNDIQRMAKESRLGIPIMPYEESLHGFIAKGHTSYPQSIGLAATWDEAFVHRCVEKIAEQDRANGARQVLSPVINVVRDARWGRIEESYGEDPLLTSKMGVAFVSALEKAGVVTTPKHYVANLWDGGRDSHSVEISERSLREIYMAPFEAVFKEGGARSVMCSYNAVNGEPAATSHWLLTDILRGEWGFRGYVVSDWGAAPNVWTAFHQADNATDTAALLINAGMDCEHPNQYMFGKGLEEAVKSKKIPMRALDASVARVLRVKFEIGLFDDPFVDPNKAERLAHDAASRALALDAARKSMTLLRNERHTLPLSRRVKRLVVLGDLANGPTPLGGYSGDPGPRPSFLEGLRTAVPGARVDFVPGMGFSDTVPMAPSSALQTSDGRRGLNAAYFNNPDLQGAPTLSRVDAQLDFDWSEDAPAPGLPVNEFSVRWTGFLVAPESGDYEVVLTTDDGSRLWLNDRLVADDWTEHAPRSQKAVVRLTNGQRLPLKIEYFERSGGAVAKLGLRRLDESKGAFAESVRSECVGADAVVVFAGIREGENQDRSILDLPGNQESTILAAASSGTPVVVVLVAGSPVTMQRWHDQVGAIVDAWYPGEAGAQAIADTLFGDNNPAGRLPITFPRSVGQCPIYYNLEPSGRGYDYVDSTGEPLYAFGHGLSYSQFAYSGLKIESPKANQATITVDVKNTSSVDGDEVVQLYTHQALSSVVRPLKELKAWKRVSVRAGQTVTVRFELGWNDLAFLNAKLKRVTEPSAIDVMVGASSSDIRLRGTFRTTAQSKDNR